MREHIARFLLTAFVAMFAILAPSVGFLAIWSPEPVWAAREIMLFVILGLWLSLTWAIRERRVSRWEARNAASLAR